MHAAHLFKQSIPPIVTFNLGSLSFLTTFDFKNFKDAISSVIYGTPDNADTTVCRIPDCYSEGVLVTLRMRLLCEIYRKDSNVPQTYECLNEIVVDRGASPYLTNIECYESGRLITRVGLLNHSILNSDLGSSRWDHAGNANWKYSVLCCSWWLHGSSARSGDSRDTDLSTFTHFPARHSPRLCRCRTQSEHCCFSGCVERVVGG